MIVTANDLKELAEHQLVGNGLGAEDAHIVADVLLEAELRGRPSHGMIRLPGIVDRVRRVDRVAMKLARDGAAYALVDGQGNLGYLVAHRAARTAVAKADQAGVGLVGAFGTSHCGMLGYYASMVADAGNVAMVMCDTSPRTAPWGGAEAVLGTNPIAAAFPYHKGQVLVDLSTAAVTSGDILIAIRDGRDIPRGTAIGPDGKVTTDPEEARRGASLPIGGHKGYALSLMVQVMAGILMRGAPVPEPGRGYGVFVLAVDPEAFMERKDFASGVSELIERIKGSRTAEGVSEILIPGERAYREREMRLSDGIEVDDELMERLRGM